MIRRSQYRCSFGETCDPKDVEHGIEACRAWAAHQVETGLLCNVSFYRYENMGFLYLEEIAEQAEPERPRTNVEELMAPLRAFLKPWPEERGDRYFVPMINVYYHHTAREDVDSWEYERTTAKKTRVGRVAFVYPEKLPCYVRYHQMIVEEGLLKGDKYAFISLHENLLFSYYEEPRNNVNIKGSEEESEVIRQWMAVDPESHFDRVKAKGENFLVIPCLFTVDRVDLPKEQKTTEA